MRYLTWALCWLLPASVLAQGFGGPVVRIYGGKDDKTLLGCLTCDASFADSIFNPTGRFGSCPGSTDYDGFSLFCDRWTSTDVNPCANNARQPPALVADGDNGKYLGRLSVGGYHGHADSVCLPTSIYQSEPACRLIRDLCRTRRLQRRDYPIDPPRILDLGPCITDHKVAKITQQGKLIELEDGSVWLVSGNDQDRVITSWFAGDPVLICAGERMANVTRREAVSASRAQ